TWGKAMARTVRDASLETRTARARLKPRGEPYYRAIEQGLHLGYRKPKSGTGKWLARIAGGNRYTYEPLGPADDFSDADGVAILSYKQAQALARQRMPHKAGLALTVRTVVEEHIAIHDARAAKRRGRPVRSGVSHHLTRYVLGQEGRGKQAAIPS